MKLAFCIVTFNNAQDTNNLLVSISKILVPQNLDLEVILFDNGSTVEYSPPSSIAGLRIYTSRTQINKGYGGGANVAIGHAIGRGADVIFLLNNDVVLGETILVDNQPFIGSKAVISFDTIYPDGKLEAPYLSYYCTLTCRGGQFLKPSKFSRPYFNFAAIMINVDVIQRVGKFDNVNFFLFWEDVDFSKRLLDTNIPVIKGQGEITHLRSKTTASRPFESAFYFSKSNVRFFRKYQFFFFTPVILFGLVALRAVKYLLIGSFMKFSATILGGIEGYRND